MIPNVLDTNSTHTGKRVIHKQYTHTGLAYAHYQQLALDDYMD